MIDIQVKNLVKFFTIGENLLDGLSFDIQEGERVAIRGRNGCGKIADNALSDRNRNNRQRIAENEIHWSKWRCK